VPGVSWLKVATLAQIIGKSEKTVRRALKALEVAGIICRVPTIREQGGRGHDITIILPMSSRDQSESPRDDADFSPETLKETNIQAKKYVSESVETLDHTFTPSHIPADFTRAAKPFFGAYRIYRLWGTVKAAHRNSGLTAPLERVIDVVIQALRESVFALKARRIRGDFGGYFYGTLAGMFAVERRREVAAEGGAAFYDWLTALATV
jgi:DNA-binding transcriptional ArsR family regulator